MIIYDFDAINAHLTSQTPDFWSRLNLTASSPQGYDWKPNSLRARDLILDCYAHLSYARDIVNDGYNDGWLPNCCHAGTTAAYRELWRPHAARDTFTRTVLDEGYTIEVLDDV